jgi:hypothetical protein
VITEPNINLQGYSGAVQAGRYAHADALRFRILLDPLSLDAGEIEDNTVRHRRRANIANSTGRLVNVRAFESQKIEIPGRPMKLSFWEEPARRNRKRSTTQRPSRN